MDVLDEMGVSKLSANFFFKVIYSFYGIFYKDKIFYVSFR